MQKVSWDLNIGTVHDIVPDDKVLAFVKNLILIGHTPTVVPVEE